MKKLPTKQGATPTNIVTDQLRPYTPGFRATGFIVEHYRGLRANN